MALFGINVKTTLAGLGIGGLAHAAADWWRKLSHLDKQLHMGATEVDL